MPIVAFKVRGQDQYNVHSSSTYGTEIRKRVKLPQNLTSSLQVTRNMLLDKYDNGSQGQMLTEFNYVQGSPRG